jgi:hypothetical protein
MFAHPLQNDISNISTDDAPLESRLDLTRTIDNLLDQLRCVKESLGSSLNVVMRTRFGNLDQQLSAAGYGAHDTESFKVDENCSFCEDEDKEQVLQKFFEKIDTNGDNALSRKEIMDALGISDQQKASDRLENLKTELGKCAEDVTLDKFKEIALRMSIATGSRVRWVKGLNLSGRLARLLEVGVPFDEMKPR